MYPRGCNFMISKSHTHYPPREGHYQCHMEPDIVQETEGWALPPASYVVKRKVDCMLNKSSLAIERYPITDDWLYPNANEKELEFANMVAYDTQENPCNFRIDSRWPSCPKDDQQSCIAWKQKREQECINCVNNIEVSKKQCGVPNTSGFVGECVNDEDIEIELIVENYTHSKLSAGQHSGPTKSFLECENGKAVTIGYYGNERNSIGISGFHKQNIKPQTTQAIYCLHDTIRSESPKAAKPEDTMTDIFKRKSSWDDSNVLRQSKDGLVKKFRPVNIPEDIKKCFAETGLRNSTKDKSKFRSQVKESDSDKRHISKKRKMMRSKRENTLMMEHCDSSDEEMISDSNEISQRSSSRKPRRKYSIDERLHRMRDEMKEKQTKDKLKKKNSDKPDNVKKKIKKIKESTSRNGNSSREICNASSTSYNRYFEVNNNLIVEDYNSSSQILEDKNQDNQPLINIQSNCDDANNLRETESEVLEAPLNNERSSMLGTDETEEAGNRTIFTVLNQIPSTTSTGKNDVGNKVNDLYMSNFQKNSMHEKKEFKYYLPVMTKEMKIIKTFQNGTNISGGKQNDNDNVVLDSSSDKTNLSFELDKRTGQPDLRCNLENQSFHPDYQSPSKGTINSNIKGDDIPDKTLTSTVDKDNALNGKKGKETKSIPESSKTSIKENVIVETEIPLPCKIKMFTGRVTEEKKDIEERKVSEDFSGFDNNKLNEERSVSKPNDEYANQGELKEIHQKRGNINTVIINGDKRYPDYINLTMGAKSHSSATCGKYTTQSTTFDVDDLETPSQDDATSKDSQRDTSTSKESSTFILENKQATQHISQESDSTKNIDLQRIELVSTDVINAACELTKKTTRDNWTKKDVSEMDDDLYKMQNESTSSKKIRKSLVRFRESTEAIAKQMNSKPAEIVNLVTEDINISRNKKKWNIRSSASLNDKSIGKQEPIICNEKSRKSFLDNIDSENILVFSEDESICKYSNEPEFKSKPEDFEDQPAYVINEISSPGQSNLSIDNNLTTTQSKNITSFTNFDQSSKATQCLVPTNILIPKSTQYLTNPIEMITTKSDVIENNDKLIVKLNNAEKSVQHHESTDLSDLITQGVQTEVASENAINKFTAFYLSSNDAANDLEKTDMDKTIHLEQIAPNGIGSKFIGQLDQEGDHDKDYIIIMSKKNFTYVINQISNNKPPNTEGSDFTTESGISVEFLANQDDPNSNVKCIEQGIENNSNKKDLSIGEKLIEEQIPDYWISERFKNTSTGSDEPYALSTNTSEVNESNNSVSLPSKMESSESKSTGEDIKLDVPFKDVSLKHVPMSIEDAPLRNVSMKRVPLKHVPLEDVSLKNTILSETPPRDLPMKDAVLNDIPKNRLYPRDQCELSVNTDIENYEDSDSKHSSVNDDAVDYKTSYKNDDDRQKSSQHLEKRKRSLEESENLIDDNKQTNENQNIKESELNNSTNAERLGSPSPSTSELKKSIEPKYLSASKENIRKPSQLSKLTELTRAIKSKHLLLQKHSDRRKIGPPIITRMNALDRYAYMLNAEKYRTKVQAIDSRIRTLELAADRQNEALGIRKIGAIENLVAKQKLDTIVNRVQKVDAIERNKDKGCSKSPPHYDKTISKRIEEQMKTEQPVSPTPTKQPRDGEFSSTRMPLSEAKPMRNAEVQHHLDRKIEALLENYNKPDKIQQRPRYKKKENEAFSSLAAEYNNCVSEKNGSRKSVSPARKVRKLISETNENKMTESLAKPNNDREITISPVQIPGGKREALQTQRFRSNLKEDSLVILKPVTANVGESSDEYSDVGSSLQCCSKKGYSKITSRGGL